MNLTLRAGSNRRADEPEVALVDEIEERHAEAAVALGVGDDEAEVGFDQPRQRGFVAVVADAEGQRALFVDADPRQLRDLAQVGRQRVPVVAAGVPPGHATSILRVRLKGPTRDAIFTFAS